MTSWPLFALGDVCNINIGRTPARDTAAFWGAGHPWVSIADLNQGRDVWRTKEQITERAVAECNCKPVAAGTVLLSFKLSLGKVGIARTRLFTNEAIAALPIKNGAVLPEYLYRVLRWVDLSAGVDRAAKGMTLNKSKLQRVKIPVPPLPEQRRIAAILDKVDELRAKRRAALEQLNGLTQAIFLEMFGDPAMNPKGWVTESLSEVVQLGTIVTYGIVQAGDEFPGGVPYIRTGDIVDGEIVQSGLRRTDPRIAARFDRSRVSGGDIVMSIRATVGTTALVPNELDGANLTQGTARIAPGGETDRFYLLSCLRAPGSQRWIERQVKGATFREITLARLRQLPVPVPPLALQKAFACRVSQTETVKSSLRESLGTFDSLFGALQHCAFNGAL